MGTSLHIIASLSTAADGNDDDDQCFSQSPERECIVTCIPTQKSGRSPLLTAITPKGLDILDIFYGHTNARLGINGNPDYDYGNEFFAESRSTVMASMRPGDKMNEVVSRYLPRRHSCVNNFGGVASGLRQIRTWDNPGYKAQNTLLHHLIPSLASARNYNQAYPNLCKYDLTHIFLNKGCISFNLALLSNRPTSLQFFRYRGIQTIHVLRFVVWINI